MEETLARLSQVLGTRGESEALKKSKIISSKEIGLILMLNNKPGEAILYLNNAARGIEYPQVRDDILQAKVLLLLALLNTGRIEWAWKEFEYSKEEMERLKEVPWKADACLAFARMWRLKIVWLYEKLEKNDFFAGSRMCQAAFAYISKRISNRAVRLLDRGICDLDASPDGICAAADLLYERGVCRFELDEISLAKEDFAAALSLILYGEWRPYVEYELGRVVLQLEEVKFSERELQGFSAEELEVLRAYIDALAKEFGARSLAAQSDYLHSCESWIARLITAKKGSSSNSPLEAASSSPAGEVVVNLGARISGLYSQAMELRKQARVSASSPLEPVYDRCAPGEDISQEEAAGIIKKIEGLAGRREFYSPGLSLDIMEEIKRGVKDSSARYKDSLLDLLGQKISAGIKIVERGSFERVRKNVKIEVRVVDLGDSRGFKRNNGRPLSSFTVLIKDEKGNFFLRILLAKAFVEENKSDPDIITQNVTYILHRILGLTHFEAILEETEFTRGKAGRMFLSELNRWFIRDALARDSDYGYLFRVIQSYQKKENPVRLFRYTAWIRKYFFTSPHMRRL